MLKGAHLSLIIQFQIKRKADIADKQLSKTLNVDVSQTIEVSKFVSCINLVLN